MQNAASILVAALAACSTAAAGNGDWTHEVVLDAGNKLGGCAAGDLIPGGADELAAVSGSGEVWVARREGDGWKGEVAARVPGEMIQCAAGTVAAGREGEQLVAVGMAAGTEDDGGEGAAWLVFREQDEWRKELVAKDSALIHGVAVCELDPAHEGDEVLLVGFSLEARIARRRPEVVLAAPPPAPGWDVETVATLPGPGKHAVAYRGGAAIACADGSLVHLTLEAGEWQLDVLHGAQAGYARLGARGDLLLAARDDGAVVLFGDGEPEVVHREGQKMRGAALLEVGGELVAATAGYEGKLSALRRGEEGWEARVLHEEDARFHHLALAGTADGQALVACGYSGRLLLVHPPRP